MLHDLAGNIFAREICPGARFHFIYHAVHQVVFPFHTEKIFHLSRPQELGIKDRLERMIYLADDRNVIAKFVNGNGFLRDKDGIKRTFFGGNQ